MQEYEQLKALVEAAEDDIIKAEGGNKAAGTRVRKSMQEIKQAAQEVRIKILLSGSASQIKLLNIKLKIKKINDSPK